MCQMGAGGGGHGWGWAVDPACTVVNPKPHTLHPQPWPLNPQPRTLNPKPSTMHPKGRHAGVVRGIAFAPGGRRLAAGENLLITRPA